jgi:hypothetical protein
VAHQRIFIYPRCQWSMIFSVTGQRQTSRHMLTMTCESNVSDIAARCDRAPPPEIKRVSREDGTCVVGYFGDAAKVIMSEKTLG